MEGRHSESTFLHVDLERALFRATVVAQLACEVLDLVVHGVYVFLQPEKPYVELHKIPLKSEHVHSRF